MEIHQHCGESSNLGDAYLEHLLPQELEAWLARKLNICLLVFFSIRTYTNVKSVSLRSGVKKEERWSLSVEACHQLTHWKRCLWKGTFSLLPKVTHNNGGHWRFIACGNHWQRLHWEALGQMWQQTEGAVFLRWEWGNVGKSDSPVGFLRAYSNVNCLPQKWSLIMTSWLGTFISLWLWRNRTWAEWTKHFNIENNRNLVCLFFLIWA